jgi:hypothetical protein
MLPAVPMAAVSGLAPCPSAAAARLPLLMSSPSLVAPLLSNYQGLPSAQVQKSSFVTCCPLNCVCACPAQLSPSFSFFLTLLHLLSSLLCSLLSTQLPYTPEMFLSFD